MNWKTIAAAATQDTLDDLEQTLWDAGAVSVTVEDGGENPLFEPGPGETPVWEQVVVTGLFEEDVDLVQVRDQLALHDFTFLFVDELGDRVWEREWLSRFEPMQFGSRLWVCPTGQDVPDRHAVVMHLDPGLAFGTGTHPTTRLCLEWLDQNIKSGLTVVDYGCGSGILGIAALLLGAREVTGVDLDPQALTATLSNAERNGVEDRLKVFLPGDAPRVAVDVLVANILARPLIDLAGYLQDLIVPGGAIALSGIMESQKDWVADAYQSIDFQEARIEDGWVCLQGIKSE
ncbi:MAG: 50S ribosomal protein L11 methyltransferase [Pseudomonadales bacterium]